MLMDIKLLLPVPAPVPRPLLGELEVERMVDRVFAAPFVDARQVPSHCVSRPDSGELRLALAVLEDGLCCAIRHGDSRVREQWRAARAALDWIESDDTSHFYAFERLCQLFAIEPQWLRRRVQREIERRRSQSEAA